jgi:hypothetical protein
MADSPIPGPHAGIDAAEDALDNVEKGFDALFAVELIEDVMAAIDFEALEAGAPPEEVFDREQLRATMGEPVGRVVAREVAGRAVGGGLAGVLGREVAGRAGAAVGRALLEEVDPDAALDPFGSMDSPDRGPAEDPVRIEVEDVEDE